MLTALAESRHSLVWLLLWCLLAREVLEAGYVHILSPILSHLSAAAFCYASVMEICKYSQSTIAAPPLPPPHHAVKPNLKIDKRNLFSCQVNVWLKVRLLLEFVGWAWHCRELFVMGIAQYSLTSDLHELGKQVEFFHLKCPIRFGALIFTGNYLYGFCSYFLQHL